MTESERGGEAGEVGGAGEINQIKKPGTEIKAKLPSDYQGLLHSSVVASTNHCGREGGMETK